MAENDSANLETELVVIGGGPGGYAAAFRAADLGKQVALVERRPHLGGVCLLEGCVPSKAMISAANLVQQMHAAERMGIDVAGVSIRMLRMAAWRDGIVNDLARAIEGLAKRRNIELFHGRAVLEDAHRIRVEHLDDAATATAKVTRLRFEHAVLATGHSPSFRPAWNPMADGSWARARPWNSPRFRTVCWLWGEGTSVWSWAPALLYSEAA